jgi:hypothetical protein
VDCACDYDLDFDSCSARGGEASLCPCLHRSKRRGKELHHGGKPGRDGRMDDGLRPRASDLPGDDIDSSSVTIWIMFSFRFEKVGLSKQKGDSWEGR